jgi:dTDP-4-amino-4,6-dideoxygalactose transaminase
MGFDVQDRLFLSAPHMGGSELPLVQQAFESNYIAPTGPMVTRFEQGLADLTGIGEVAALSSGTAALHLALRIAGIERDDEVWGSTMTFIGGVAPIRYLDATPVFLDIEGECFLLDLDLLESELTRMRALNRVPKAVISTDLYGHVIDGERMRTLADDFGFVWISDAAEAVGASRYGRHAGHGADLTILSFNGNKLITTSGGGALASDNKEWIDEARFLSTQARDAAIHYEHSTIGYNYRLSNISAAIGIGQLDVVEERVNQRRRVHSVYRQRLGKLPGIAFSPEPGDMRANRWLTTITIDPQAAGYDREAIRLALEHENIESRPLWKPMHLQPVFSDAPYRGGRVAEDAFAIGLCLPSGSAMTDGDIDRVCVIIEALAGR